MLIIRLGSHGRLLGDDFCHLVTGLEYGPWGNVLYWRDSLNGSYSFYFLHGLLAPFDTQATGINVIIIVLVWSFGLAWLILAGHRLFKRARPPLALAFILAAALVWLSIHGLPTLHSIYFYSAASRHTLPIAFLVAAVAACCEAIPRLQSFRRLAVACVLFALAAFINAGMSEVFAIVQLALFTTLLPAIYAVFPRESRRSSLALGLSGWVGTGAALSIMATAPGVARRLDMFGSNPHRPLSPVDLLPKILEVIRVYMFDTELNAAFLGMFAISLFTILALQRPRQISPSPKPFQLAAPPLWLALIAQALLLPLVWSNQSDNPLLFARFSPAYMVVVSAQLLLMLSLAAVLLSRKRINAVLRRNPDYGATIPALTLVAVLVLFSIAQLRSINWHAQTYISGSIYLLLLVLVWQFHFHFRAVRKSRASVYVYWAFAVIGMGALALVVFNLAITGRLIQHNLSFLPFAVALAGFICGMSLAFSINTLYLTTAARRPTRAVLCVCGIVAAAVWLSVVSIQAQSIPQFERFSQAWDARHQLVLDKFEARERLEEPPYLPREMRDIVGGFIRTRHYWQSSCASAEITTLLEEKYRAPIALDHGGA